MDFPSYFKFTRTPMPEFNTAVQSTETRSLKVLNRKVPAQRLEFTFNGFTVNHDCNTGQKDTQRFHGEFIAASQAGFTIFDYKPNDIFLTRPIFTITADAVSAGQDEFIIKTALFDGSAESDIVPGKLIRISNADKVYMITKVVRTNDDGGFEQYIITLSSGLVAPCPASQNIVIDETLRVKLRLDGNVIRGNTPNVNFNKTVYQFRMIEAL